MPVNSAFTVLSCGALVAAFKRYDAFNFSDWFQRALNGRSYRLRMSTQIAKFIHAASVITPIEYVLYCASMCMLIPTTARMAGVV